MTTLKHKHTTLHFFHCYAECY